MTLDEFIEKVCQRPLPSNPMARIRTLAKELAEGTLEGVWNTSSFPTYDGQSQRAVYGRWFWRIETVEIYIFERWDNQCPSLDLLEYNGYLAPLEIGGSGRVLRLTENAFRLVEEVQPSTIFISYKRSESSAFAMLVLKALKEKGLDAFLDMSIKPGDNWHQHIKEKIESHDHFVLLLGKKH